MDTLTLVKKVQQVIWNSNKVFHVDSNLDVRWFDRKWQKVTKTHQPNNMILSDIIDIGEEGLIQLLETHDRLREQFENEI